MHTEQERARLAVEDLRHALFMLEGAEPDSRQLLATAFWLGSAAGKLFGATSPARKSAFNTAHKADNALRDEELDHCRSLITHAIRTLETSP